jgi:hypothetical protein
VSIDFNFFDKVDDPLSDLRQAFKDCFKTSDRANPCFVYIRAADLAFSRKDIENDEEDTKLNDLKTQFTIEILNAMDKIAQGEGRRTIIIMSLSENYSAVEFDQYQGIPFFFASDRIDKIIAIQ